MQQTPMRREVCDGSWISMVALQYDGPKQHVAKHLLGEILLKVYCVYPCVYIFNRHFSHSRVDWEIFCLPTRRRSLRRRESFFVPTISHTDSLQKNKFLDRHPLSDNTSYKSDKICSLLKSQTPSLLKQSVEIERNIKQSNYNTHR